MPHAPENLFDLVSDIRRYPEFIRWIQSMRVSAERADGTVSRCIGEARVGFSGLTESFATTVAADAQTKRIETRLVRGPFRRLENNWHFIKQPDGSTRVDFTIDYQFKNPILQALLSANFDRAVNALIAAFLSEADRRYPRVRSEPD